jgi:hypothetical protein
MGFMKLLGTSHAFGRILNQPSRYRLTEQSLLPKFGSEKRPERSAGQDSAGLLRAFSPQTESAQPVGMGAAKGGLLSRILQRRKNKTMNTVEADPSMASASAPSKPEHAFPFGRWTLFKSPFNQVPAAAPQSKSDAGPVQGELLLDAIKPVRNDLSDSDLEVVQSASQKVREPVICLTAPIAGSPDQTAPVWRRVAAQFSGAVKH